MFAALFMGAWFKCNLRFEAINDGAAFLPAVLYSLIAILGVGGESVFSITYYNNDL